MGRVGSDSGFGDVLLSLVEAGPERPALTFEGVMLSRRELVDRAGRLAVRFAELGVSSGRLVTIGLPNSVEFVEAMLAVWWLGAVPQPISDRLPAIERSAIIELADPALALGVPTDESGGRPTLSVEEIAAIAGGPAEGRVPAPVTAPVWKVITSGGSTGRPKLIVSGQPAVRAAAEGFAALLRFPSDGTVLVTGPMSHNGPFVVMTVGLLLGNHVLLMRRFDPSEALRLTEAHRVQWLYLVPTMMSRIWRLPEEERRGRDLSALQIAFHVGAPCPAWLKHAWIEWLGPVGSWRCTPEPSSRP